MELHSTLPKIFIRSKNVMERIYLLLNGFHSGIWLSLLNQEQLHHLDEYYYSTWPMYTSQDHNTRGFFEWERPLISEYFRDKKEILVAGAGGGREILAGHKMGISMQGFECNDALRSFGNNLLHSQGSETIIIKAKRDEVPPSKKKYAGIIVGWSVYMLIPGRTIRVKFLKKLHKQLQSGSPLMMSFYLRKSFDFHLKVAYFTSKIVSALIPGSRKSEQGDFVDPNYTHFFTESEVKSELKEAGFEMIHFTEEGGGAAVARSV